MSQKCWSKSSHGSVSEVVVLAWEVHLNPFIEGESGVSIGIEEGYEVEGLTLRHMEDSVVGQESADLGGGNSATAVSVNSSEGSSWGEVWDVAESYSGSFEGSLAIGDSGEKVSESSLGFKSEHLVFVS